MQLLVDLVRSLPGIGTPQRALDAMKLGIGMKNHYQIWCHERFHADGTRCIEPEVIEDPQFGTLPGCPKWHHVSEKWKMDFYNLVVTEGRNTLLNRTFDAVGADVLWYVFLIGAGAGTVAITASASAVTGTSTAFTSADIGSDIIIVGAGTASADLLTTVAGQTSGTALTTTANAGTTVAAAAYAIEPRPADVMATKSFTDTVPYSNATRPAWTKNGTASAGAMSNSSAKATFTINATGRAFGAALVSNNTKSGTTGVLFGGGMDLTNGSRSVVNGDSLLVQIDLSVTAS